MALNILLADDSVPAQNMGKKILVEAGYEVTTVSNGLEALRKIAERKPDLAILDIFMPGYTGLEICGKLRASEATATLPVILSVGKLEPYRPQEGEQVHSDAVIVKPFATDELIATVNGLIGSGRVSLPVNAPPPEAAAAPEEEEATATAAVPEALDEPFFAQPQAEPHALEAYQDLGVSASDLPASPAPSESTGPEGLIFNPDAAPTPFSASTFELASVPAADSFSEFDLESGHAAPQAESENALPENASPKEHEWPSAAPSTEAILSAAQSPEFESAAPPAVENHWGEFNPSELSAVESHPVESSPVESASAYASEPGLVEPDLVEAGADEHAAANLSAASSNFSAPPELEDSPLGVPQVDPLLVPSMSANVDRPSDVLATDAAARREAFEELFNSPDPIPMESLPSSFSPFETEDKTTLPGAGNLAHEPTSGLTRAGADEMVEHPPEVAPAEPSFFEAASGPIPERDPLLDDPLAGEWTPATESIAEHVESAEVLEAPEKLVESSPLSAESEGLLPELEISGEIAASPFADLAPSMAQESGLEAESKFEPTNKPEAESHVAEEILHGAEAAGAAGLMASAVELLPSEPESAPLPAHVEEVVAAPEAVAAEPLVSAEPALAEPAPSVSIPTPSPAPAPAEVAAVEGAMPEKPVADGDAESLTRSAEAERIHEAVERVVDRFKPLLIAAIVRELARLD